MNTYAPDSWSAARRSASSRAAASLSTPERSELSSSSAPLTIMASSWSVTPGTETPLARPHSQKAKRLDLQAGECGARALQRDLLGNLLGQAVA
jgi:hypothetical protein